MERLQEPAAGKFDIGYRPNGETAENPPRFSFMPQQGADTYVLEIADGESFDHAKCYSGLDLNFFTPDETFPRGRYFWRYAVWRDGARCSDWSPVRRFEISGEEALTPLPGREKRYRESSAAHPRLWMNQERIGKQREILAADPTACGFDAFVRHAVKPYEDQAFCDPPPENPDRWIPEKRHNDIWRNSYAYAQEALYKIKHLAIAGRLTEDRGLLEKAKTSLLDIAAWDPGGTTSEEYNDEAAFRVLRALAWGYDWLYELLEEGEKKTVKAALVQRADQVFRRDVVEAKIHQTPYESHPVRSLSMVLIPCGIALLGEAPEAEEWLNYSLEYLACLYSPWGGEDGGWAEGGAYWTTALASVLEGADLVRHYLGIDLLKRPFFQHTGDFILQCYDARQTFSSFCDQSNLGQRPPLKTGFLMRQLAAATGNGAYQWYYEQMLPWDTASFSAFYNYGWWNFYFDDFAFRCDYGDVAAQCLSDEPGLKWFRDVGWAAMHSNMPDQENQITLLLKSSPYGCISHSHADQNGIILHAYGEPFLIESGYYVAYGSDMHLKWRKQTKSTNNILIDGMGQYAGGDKRKQLDASGAILDAGEQGHVLFAKAQAAQAYQLTVPSLRSYMRSVYFAEGAYFVIEDKIELDRELPLQWLLHSLTPFDIQPDGAALHGAAADLRIQFVSVSSGSLEITQTNSFGSEIRPEELEGKTPQWHLCATAPAAKRHRIVTLLVPEKRGQEKEVTALKTPEGIEFGWKQPFVLREE